MASLPCSTVKRDCAVAILDGNWITAVRTSAGVERGRREIHGEKGFGGLCVHRLRGVQARSHLRAFSDMFRAAEDKSIWPWTGQHRRLVPFRRMSLAWHPRCAIRARMPSKTLTWLSRPLPFRAQLVPASGCKRSRPPDALPRCADLARRHGTRKVLPHSIRSRLTIWSKRPRFQTKRCRAGTLTGDLSGALIPSWARRRGFRTIGLR